MFLLMHSVYVQSGFKLLCFYGKMFVPGSKNRFTNKLLEENFYLNLEFLRLALVFSTHFSFCLHSHLGNVLLRLSRRQKLKL